MKTYDSYRKTDIISVPMIPAHWGLKRLKHVITMSYGDALSSEVRIEGEVGVYGSNGQVGTHIDANTDAPVIVVGRKGSYGKLNFSDRPVFCIDTAYHVAQSASEANLRFMYYAMQTMGLDTSSQDTGVPGLSREVAYGQPIALPPEDEQAAIASYLDAEMKRIEGLIEAKSSLLEQLSELRTRAIYEAVFVEEPGWRRSRLKFVADGIVDTEHKTCPYVDDGQFLVVRTTNIKSGKLTLDGAKYTNEDGFREWTQRAAPRPGDILLTREAPAGEACLVPENVPLCVGQRTVLIQINRDVAHPDFVLWSLYGGLSSQFIADLSRGSTVPHFNMADIGNIPLFQGPVAEQIARTKVLEHRLDHISDLTKHVNAEVQALKDLRAATITDAVLGRIDVRPT